MELPRLITVPQGQLRQSLERLLGQGRHTLDWAASVTTRPDAVELLAVRRPTPAGLLLRLRAIEQFGAAPPPSLPENVSGLLELGLGPVEGQARGWIRTSHGQWQPAHWLHLPGPGMLAVPLGASGQPDPASAPAPEAEKWSRTVGALGRWVYRRAVSLRVGLIGLGRLNTLVVEGLVRFGLRRFVLVDPDRVELHNLGESAGYQQADLGRPKVQAWADRVAAGHLDATVEAVADSVTHHRAVEALKGCDLLFSAPDQPGARLAAAAIAAAFCRPLVDLGSMVHRAGPTTMGADIRMVMPDRCLLCCGGVRHEALGYRLLVSPDAEREFARGRDWQKERPGSLRSLNELAAAIGLRMFEDLVAGRLRESLWCHVEFEPTGRISLSYPSLDAPSDSARCACAIAGWAEAGLPAMTAVLRARAQAAQPGTD